MSAGASGEPGGWLDRLGFVFVFTYGRSGSTLLMNVLNSIDGFDIKGENHNTLYQLFKAVQAAEMSRNQPGATDRDATHPWYGAAGIRVDALGRALAEAFVAEVLRPGPGTRVTGFKEIRHAAQIIPDEDFAPYVDWVLGTFPRSRIIFNTRSAEEVAKSGWFKFQPKERVLERIRTADARFAAVAAAQARCFLIDHAETTGDAEKLAELFEFLGEDMDSRRVAEVLAVPLTHMKGADQPGPLKRLKRRVGGRRRR